jgi:glutathione S-transferase
MSGKVIVYGDSMSQPSRAVWWFALLANVPNFEYKLVQIAKQQQLSPEYAKMFVERQNWLEKFRGTPFTRPR